MRHALPIGMITVLTLGLGCSSPAPYSGCEGETLCSGDVPLCLAVGSGTRSARFCTVRCATPAARSTECPNNGVCMKINGAGPYCLQQCDNANTCGFSHAGCITTPESMGQRVCTLAP